jgi:hypothetical protein
VPLRTCFYYAGLGVLGFLLKFVIVARKPAAQLYNLTLCINSRSRPRLPLPKRLRAGRLIRAVHISSLSVYLNDKRFEQESFLPAHISAASRAKHKKPKVHEFHKK